MTSRPLVPLAVLLGWARVAAAQVDAGTPTDAGAIVQPVAAPADGGPPLTVPAGTGGRGAIENTATTPPPVSWKSWTLAGHLIDDEDTLRGFLAPVMQRWQGKWGDEAQQEVSDLLGRLGYVVTFRSQPVPDGGVTARIHLEPVTLIRTVDADTDLSFGYHFLEPIFSDDLLRHMSLRPGMALLPPGAARAGQLEDERHRIQEYLRNEGFYDARATIAVTLKGRYSARLDVAVSMGEPYTLGRIAVSGNAAIETSEILRIFHDESRRCVLVVCADILGDRRFTRAQLTHATDAVVELYRQRGYYGVTVRTDFDPATSYHRDSKTVSFNVEVRERRKIDVVFEGNSKGFTEDKLGNELTMAKEGSYDDVEVDKSAAAIRHFYQARGFFETSVLWDRERFGVVEHVVYTIDEGPQLDVQAVEFEGNRALSNHQLAGAIVTRPYSELSLGKKSGGYATSLQLLQDADAIATRYRAAGYPEVVVDVEAARSRHLLGHAAAQSAAVAAGARADGLYVRFHIHEGTRVTIGDVRLELEGPSELSPATLRRAITLQPGSPFDPEVASADGEAIKRAYRDAGFPRATVATTIEPGPSAATRIVVHTIAGHSLARIGKIAIRGNFKTRAWVIRDLLAVHEGDLLTSENYTRPEASLRASGLFSSVQIDRVGLEDPNEPVVNMVVRVEERHDNRGEILVGLGYRTDYFDFYAELKYDHYNLFGAGVLLEGHLVFSPPHFLETTSSFGAFLPNQYALDSRLVIPPWLVKRAIGTRLSFETSAFVKREERPRFGLLNSKGLSLQATKDLGAILPGLSLAARYDFKVRNRNVDLVRPTGNSDDIVQTPVSTTSSTIGPILTLSRLRDEQGHPNPFAPAAGFLLEARADYGEDYVFGNDRFLKLGLRAQHFWTFGNGRFLLSNNVRYDHGIPLGGASLLPDVERFFAGGDNTVRGFEEDRLATEIVEDDLSPLGGVRQFHVIPAGGNIRFIHNLDLQVVVWEVPKLGFPLASAIFLDTGLVTNSLVGFKVSDLRHSIGIALARMVTPVGSFSFEWAVPLDPELGDNPRGRLHIRFGFFYGS